MSIEFRTRSKAIQPDGNDVGACCTINASNEFSCEDNVSYIECKRNLGIFRGKNSTCATQGCPTGSVSQPLVPLNSDLHGACKTCSSCTDNLLEADCITQTNFDAEFFNGKVCSEVESENLSSIKDQKYACCIDDGSCFDTCNSDYCASLGGLFHDGVQTALGVLCSSNPCDNLNNITEIGSCCRSEMCIGLMTQFDCVRNNGDWTANADCTTGGNYDCLTGSFIEGNSNQGSSEQQTSFNGSLVCSSPTPKKYYHNENINGNDTAGKWNGTLGPTYSSEPVWINIVETIGQCNALGGIVSSEDGDFNKAIMWGGCQYPNGDGWSCQSKTQKQCTDLQGKWWPGIYCDDIRSAPSSGLLFASTMPAGIDDRYLAGSCHIKDSVQSKGLHVSVDCGDMKTQYQCANALQKRKDYYLQVLKANNNVNWTENNLSAEFLSASWRPGKRCTEPQCVAPFIEDTDVTLGRCEINNERNAVYWSDINNSKKTVIVTVARASSDSGNRFYFDGVENPENYPLTRGVEYTFDLSNVPTNHPFGLSETENGTLAVPAGTQYTNGWTTNGTQGTPGANAVFNVPANAPATLWYYCSNHSGMGNSLAITTVPRRTFIDYTYNTGKQTACVDNYTLADCEILHGEWHSSCQTCEDQGLTTPLATGSCCTDTNTCLDGKTYLECQSVNGFFHGPGTSCTGRDCGKVAFLEPVTDEDNLPGANCKCIVAEEPTLTAKRVFARFDNQDQEDIWAGSTCGDPTVDAIPYYNSETNFAKNTLVTYIDPPPSLAGESTSIFTDTRPIGDLKYNMYNEKFKPFIVSALNDESGTFLDDIVIDARQCYFRVDKKEPFVIPFATETLKNIKGITLETNQPLGNITRLILNDPDFYWTGGNGYVPENRKIKYVNFEGMTNLRHLALQGIEYPDLQSNLELAVLANLTVLDLRLSGLSGLNLVFMPKLERLTLSNNNITSLDLSGSQNITSADLTYNSLNDLTFAEDSIYLADLRVGYNSQLSSIGGSYPQLETFYAQRCNFSELNFSNMPFLLDVQLQNNPLTNLNINKCPSVDYINLDSCISGTTELSNFTLPSQTNRTLSKNNLPDSIKDAIIPSPSTSLNRFSFRRNSVQETGYDIFVTKLAETIAITRFTDLNDTIFNAVGTFTNRGDNPVYCETIDLSGVTDTVSDGDGNTTGSAKKILEYIFGGITNVNQIKHDLKIRIILTGINSSVDYSSLNIDSSILRRMSFIN